MASWGDKIRQVAQKRGVSTEKMVKSVAIQGMNTAIKMTPVGNESLWKSPAPDWYSGGHMRSNWRATINKVDYVIKNGVDYSGTYVQAISDVAGFKLGDIVYFTNPVPYSLRIEYDSWSSQAPNGIVRPTIKAIKNAINKEIKGG